MSSSGNRCEEDGSSGSKELAESPTTNPVSAKAGEACLLTGRSQQAPAVRCDSPARAHCTRGTKEVCGKDGHKATRLVGVAGASVLDVLMLQP